MSSSSSRDATIFPPLVTAPVTAAATAQKLVPTSSPFGSC